MAELYNITQLKSDQNLLGQILQRVGIVDVDLSYPMTRLSRLLETLRDEVVVAIEYDYVDSMYRDEYYRYYATKFGEYRRNCARMSFFEPGVLEPGGTIDYSRSEEIASQYLGYVVIRPINSCIGRNVIAVRAKRTDFSDIRICQTLVHTTALGIKVSVAGFPHSSQDSEVMACAETALWSIAEYYGHKYPHYKPVLPTDILEAMRPSMDHRQLPSKGLTFSQIARGMKACGFNPEIYSLYVNGGCLSGGKVVNPKMLEVLSCYIESGFPLALCLQGSQIGHAVVCVGKSKKQEVCSTEKLGGKSFNFPYKTVSEIVVNDDNVACYQKTSLSSPVAYIGDAKWSDVKITNFMVPLPSRVYMDALMAVEQMKYLLSCLAPDGAYARIFLASCRSLRDHIAHSQLLSNEDKVVLLEVNMPRFVWVCEIGNKDDYDNRRSSGLILIDATDMSAKSANMLILSLDSNGRGILHNNQSYENLSLPTPYQLESYNKNIY